jgi:hypothetical protein
MVVPDSSDVEKESPMVLCKLERLGVPQPLLNLSENCMPHPRRLSGLTATFRSSLECYNANSMQHLGKI